MKIAVWHNTGPGGARRYLHDHVRMLAGKGHRVESWCLSTANQDFLPMRAIVPEHVVPVEAAEAEPRGLAARAAFRFWATSRRLAAVDAACRRCAEEIASGGFDVLLATNCVLTTIAPIATYIRIPSVLYLQEPRRTLYEATPDLPWVAGSDSRGGLRKTVGRAVDLRNMRMYARAEKANAAAFDRILVNSFFSRESVLRAYGLDSRVCYMGMDTNALRNAGRPRENIVLGVGEFSRHKNLPFVIDAVAAMTRTRPRLVWVGNGGSKAHLNEMKDYAAARQVDFDPRFGVRDDELMDLYNRAGVLVYAPRLEPFGLVVIEANACGLLVVAVAEGGPRETIRDGVNGFLVEPDPGAMAAAAERLLLDPALAAELGRHARQAVEEFWTLDHSTTRLEKFLLSAAGKKGA